MMQKYIAKPYSSDLTVNHEDVCSCRSWLDANKSTNSLHIDVISNFVERAVSACDVLFKFVFFPPVAGVWGYIYLSSV